MVRWTLFVQGALNAFACWLLRDFSDQCEDIAPEPIIIVLLLLLRDFLQHEVQQERKYRVVSERTVWAFVYLLTYRINSSLHAILILTEKSPQSLRWDTGGTALWSTLTANIKTKN
jgi:hypothetical protein